MDSPSDTTAAEKPLYHIDFFRWSQVQAEAIRAAASVRINTPVPIDWENVAEEIEDLGKSIRGEVRSRVRVILEHLLKLSASPAGPPRAGWRGTIRVQRLEVEELLNESPSLRCEVPAIMTAQLAKARQLVAQNAVDHRETLIRPLDELNFTPGQVLEDWFPAEP